MNSESKRKSISLFLIIFIMILIILLAILAIKLLKNKDNTNLSDNNSNAQAQLSIETNDIEFNDVENTSNFNEITNYIENTNSNSENTTKINETITNSTENSIDNQITDSSYKLTLNNHTYKFKNNEKASIIQDNEKSAIQTINSDFNYKMLFNTDNTTTFNALKENSNLKTSLESNYNFTITSNLKIGNINNLNVIAFTISDINGIGYCVITPLNDTEITYTKIYNTANTAELISDLSNPLTEISSIIENLEN